MINKYIKIEQGSYRNQDMSGRIFPILKDYQAKSWADAKAQWSRLFSKFQAD